MDSSISPRKKLKSTGQEGAVNTKTSVTCTNVPESLFEATAVKKHFSKFGRVQKIRLIPKRQMCIIEYDQPISAERAVLNAGAYDGFMFDVTRTKARVRRRSKKDDDPDWVPDEDVEEELSAMSGTPIYRVTRQKPMEIEPQMTKVKPIRAVKELPLRKKVPVREKQSAMSQPIGGIESPLLVTTTQTSLSTLEAAIELHQLRSRISLTPDEQWRTLDARDRILRAWGGAGSRIKVGGATIGTCLDMCPEKELLHRQAEHQVMTLETVIETDSQLDPWRAVKQYSRSSADQEIPMCYELRPAAVLMRTCAYLLHEIADTKRQVTLADWFHFMWDRLRSIRKDITQQALCCAESIKLVEMCARFHAHCAARLADLEHTQFDQKLNTDNLTKCLQTLKHMYVDVGPEQKPREAEFRGYIALLNLGDANFWWEIKQLPQDIQKSEAIMFAIQIFNALDNNNYVRFFRLVKEKATYLQACILLRYFNDVRARALARIVKAYAPRGGSRYPAQELMNALAFESIESMKFFINHYGLRFSKTDDSELSVILDRNQFIEDSDPYSISRAVKLIESKRQCTVGEVISGGQLPNSEFREHKLYSSFKSDGTLKESSLIAEDQGYNTINDSNKDIQALKAELEKLAQGGRSFVNADSKANLFSKPETKTLSSGKKSLKFSSNEFSGTKLFFFKPAIPVASVDIIKNSPEKVFEADTKSIFSFSKPQESLGTSVFTGTDSGNLFKHTGNNLFNSKPVSENNNLFEKAKNENKDIFLNSQNMFRETDDTHIFKKPDIAKSVFGQFNSGNSQQNYKADDINKNVFGIVPNKSIFSKKDATSKIENENTFGNKSIFSKVKEDIFPKSDNTVKLEKGSNIFAKPLKTLESSTQSKIFSTFNKTNAFADNNQLFTKQENSDNNNSKSLIATNGETLCNKLSPSSLFKSACNLPNIPDTKSYSIFQSKNKTETVAANIFNSIHSHKNDAVYEFDQNDNEAQKQLFELQRLNEERLKEQERRRIEVMKKEEERKNELKRQEEERRKEEIRKAEELKCLEEKRKKEEERKQEELRKKLEEEKKAELKRRAEEEKRKFKLMVEKESVELTEDLINEVNEETVKKVMMEEVEKVKSLMSYAGVVTDEILTELCHEICISELKAEKIWSEKLMKKWFYIWKKNCIRNIKRRYLLEDTPVWLTNKTAIQEASNLRRSVENAVLKNMNAIHRGYKFTGELRQIPSPDPYNIMEIIKSPLLKRMKQINYPYDKCFFWKVTLISPVTKWLYKKIDIEKWLLGVFSDKKHHDTSDSLIYVSKQSWNHLIDFAISVSLTNKQKRYNYGEAIEGTNGMLFYINENDHNFMETIEEILKHKYPYQVIPLAIVMPKMKDDYLQKKLEILLNDAVCNNVIMAFKIYVLDPNNPFESLNLSTRNALKWMAKKYPQVPPLEIDYLKSLCQRYLGNEIWYRLRSEKDARLSIILKDLCKLVSCYNAAVDKLTNVITNEDLFNYPSFPLEFKEYLDHLSPYPKPYEFISSKVKNSENVSAIKDIMKQLKLPNPVLNFYPMNVSNMQDQIRKYCNQIEWFENPEEVVCKVVSVLPNEFSDVNMPCKEFSEYYEHYDLVDFLNVLVYEKITNLKNFDNRSAIYEKSVLEEYRNMHWLYEIEILSKMKHKSLEYEDDLDLIIDAKRRKTTLDSIEYLVFEEKDCTLVDENLKAVDKSISQYSDCKKAVKQLEEQIEEEKKKSIQLENLLRAALSN